MSTAAPPLSPPRPPGPPPAPSANGRLREPAWKKAWHRLRVLWRPAARDMSAAEADLVAEIDRLRAMLYDRDCRIFQLEHDLSRRDSECKILACEVELWAGVHLRDRTRLEADQALYAHAAARAHETARRGESP